MRRMRGRRERNLEAAELNITAFMNLMVILVPFLLITAVFSRVAILELNLPVGNDAKGQDKPDFHLQVIVRDSALDVADTRGGLIKRLPKQGDDYDYAALSKLLQQIKARFPDKTAASILSEPQTSYNTLIQVMDTVRMFKSVQFGEAINAELFPDISIGDAPPPKNAP